MHKNPLGQNVSFPDRYDPGLLFAISRDESRHSLGLASSLPFAGYDRWNCYELFWQDIQGKVHCGVLQMDVPAQSPSMVESKSLKLYLHSLCSEKFASTDLLVARIRQDLERLIGAPCIFLLNATLLESSLQIEPAPGLCIDTASASEAAFTMHSHLLHTCCPVTGQPDVATVVISYEGRAIAPASLAKYIASLRGHPAFHEHTCEKIFLDLLEQHNPKQLFVWCAYTRRGGIDINPVRFTPGFGNAVAIKRLARQ